MKQSKNNSQQDAIQSRAVANNQSVKKEVTGSQLFKDNRADSIRINRPVQKIKYTSTPTIQRMKTGAALKKLEGSINGKDQKNFIAALEQMKLNEDVPDEIVNRLFKGNMPQSYLPTTTKMWVEFLERIIKSIKSPITEKSIKKMDLSEQEEDEGLELERGKILKVITEDEKGAEGRKDKLHPFSQTKKMFTELEPLADKIYNATLTCNFALDKLFNYDVPLLLNAFQVKEKLKIESNNIKGDLADERAQAEADLFFGKGQVSSRLRPRYAALNLHGHTFGAASRNDYGLSHFVLKDDIKKVSTFTWGDTFDAKDYGASTITKKGILNMLLKVAQNEIAPYQIVETGEWYSLLHGKIYKSSDMYLDSQIHADLDIRKDVKEIIISTAEMKLFGVSLDVVDKMIKELTGGLFVRVE